MKLRLKSGIDVSSNSAFEILVIVIIVISNQNIIKFESLCLMLLWNIKKFNKKCQFFKQFYKS